MGYHGRVDALLDKIQALTPKFAACGKDNDEERKYPLENMRALVALGLPAMGLSRELGGMALSLIDQLKITEAIARADGSTALALSMHRAGAELISAVPNYAYGQSILREVASEGSMLCSVVSLPTTETDSRKAGLVALDDGDHWIISGRSGFATNSEGSKYIVLACSNGHAPGVVMVPARLDSPEIHLLCNWAGMGMRSSASHDVTVDKLRFPKKDACELTMEQLGLLGDDNAGKTGQFAILGVWTGLAQAALEFTTDYLVKRHGFMAGTGFNAMRPEMDQARGEQAWAQIIVGEMDCALWAARTALYAFAQKFDSGFYRVGEPVRPDRMRIYLTVRNAVETVLMSSLKVCGAHAYVNSKPLERIFRDGLAGIVMKEKNAQLAQALGAVQLSAPAVPNAAVRQAMAEINILA